MNFEKMIKDRKGSIVDVRSPDEFKTGHAEGAINIPLQEFPQRKEELKTLKHPLVVCCASGIRSAKAQGYLVRQGIECFNAGTWSDIKSYQEQPGNVIAV